MTRAQLIAEIAERADLGRFTVRKVLDALATVAAEELVGDPSGEVPLGRELGKLLVVDRKARRGRNPATGEEIEIPAGKAVRFWKSWVLKEALEGREGPSPFPGGPARASGVRPRNDDRRHGRGTGAGSVNGVRYDETAEGKRDIPDSEPSASSGVRGPGASL